MADDKESESMSETIMRWRRGQDAIIIGVLIVCVALIVGAFGGITAVQDMADSKHLTDPGIAVKDLKNATFTFTVDEIHELSLVSWCFFTVGLVGFLIAEAFIFVTPTDTKLHRRLCTGTGEQKYCPECGLKLSRLQR